MVPKKGSKGSKKYGRNEKKCAEYKNAKRREKNKLKRIYQSNGEKAAIAYAKEHGIAV